MSPRLLAIWTGWTTWAHKTTTLMGLQTRKMCKRVTMYNRVLPEWPPLRARSRSTRNTFSPRSTGFNANVTAWATAVAGEKRRVIRHRCVAKNGCLKKARWPYRKPGLPATVYLPHSVLRMHLSDSFWDDPQLSSWVDHCFVLIWRTRSSDQSGWATYDRLQVTGVLWPGSAHNRIIPKVSLRMIINHQKPKHFLRGLPVRLLPVTVDCQALNSQPSASPGTPVAANGTETHEFLQVVSI